MEFECNLLKMNTEYGSPIKYYMELGSERICMNDFIGKQISIRYLHEIDCITCGAKTSKSYHEGHCYNCFMTLPECDLGVIFPEKDMSHLGISRDMKWSEKYSLTPHFVYLAISGNLKVGVTRCSQIPTRWIDQGAVYAIRLAKTPNRNLAGLIEVELKKYVSDKTNWQIMLSGKFMDINLLEQKNRLLKLLPNDLKFYQCFDDSITQLNFPYVPKTDKFINVNLDQDDFLEGVLVGIKAQYLIFNDSKVLNIRRYSGYRVVITIN